jgi:hypothetical protein
MRILVVEDEKKVAAFLRKVGAEATLWKSPATASARWSWRWASRMI